MVDLETSGLVPGYNEITEAAFVSDTGAELSFRLSFDESKAHPQAMKVQGFGTRDYAPLMAHHTALDQVGRMFDPLWDETDPNIVCDERDYPYVVAWPAQFDVAFLACWHARHGVQMPWHYRNVLDVRSFASAVWGINCDLSDEWVEEVFDIRRRDFPEHTALGDARFQAAIFRKILADAEIAQAVRASA